MGGQSIWKLYNFNLCQFQRRNGIHLELKEKGRSTPTSVNDGAAGFSYRGHEGGGLWVLLCGPHAGERLGVVLWSSRAANYSWKVRVRVSRTLKYSSVVHNLPLTNQFLVFHKYTRGLSWCLFLELGESCL